MEGKWLSVLEFAAYKNKSISTVRRYIKANRVKHKEDSGKYYIFVKDFKNKELESERRILELELENQQLNKKLQMMSEEVSELKMLINIYEADTKIPELPNEL